MSFLLKVARTPVAIRAAAPQQVARLSTTSQYQKDTTDTVKDTASKVNKKVGEAAVAGIEAGRMLFLKLFFQN
jgi:hypothetical protein